MLDSPLTHPTEDNWHDELRATIRLALPLVGANLLQMAVFAVDVMFCARLSELNFAASTLGVFMFSLLNWGLIGLVSASAPLIAAELGHKAHSVRDVRRTFRMSLWLGAFSMVPVAIILFWAEPILLLAGQKADVAARTEDFTRILLFAGAPAIASSAMRIAAAALGRPNWALGITAISLGVAILTNWLFVFGNGGFPALGLEGAALASVSTATVTMFTWFGVMNFDRKLRRYRLFGRWWRAEWARLSEMTKLGTPIALSWMMEGALFGGAALLMGLISVASVNAHAIALNLASLTFQIPLGIAQAGTIRVGLAYGARNRAAIHRAGWTAIALGTGVMALTAIAMWLFPTLMISIYINPDNPANREVVDLATKFLMIAAIFQLLDGAQVSTASALRGLQDTRVPMFISLVSYWGAGIGSSALLAFGLGWAGVGVWSGLAIGLVFASVLLIWRWMARERLVLVPSAGQKGKRSLV